MRSAHYKDGSNVDLWRVCFSINEETEFFCFPNRASMKRAGGPSLIRKLQNGITFKDVKNKLVDEFKWSESPISMDEIEEAVHSYVITSLFYVGLVMDEARGHYLCSVSGSRNIVSLIIVEFDFPSRMLRGEFKYDKKEHNYRYTKPSDNICNIENNYSGRCYFCGVKFYSFYYNKDQAPTFHRLNFPSNAWSGCNTTIKVCKNETCQEIINQKKKWHFDYTKNIQLAKTEMLNAYLKKNITKKIRDKKL